MKGCNDGGMGWDGMGEKLVIFKGVICITMKGCNGVEIGWDGMRRGKEVGYFNRG